MFFRTYDLPEELMDQLVVTTKPIYNLKKLLVGNWFELERLPDGTLKQFLYEIDLTRISRSILPTKVTKPPSSQSSTRRG